MHHFATIAIATIASARLWIESDGSRVKFVASPRIGIAYASKRDQNRKWRFTLYK